MLLVQSADAAILRVGPGGDFATIQAAVDDALSSTADDEIRIVAGTFTESVDVFIVNHPKVLSISGGWSTDFLAVESTTTISGGGINRVLSLDLSAGDSVILDGLIVRDGAASRRAGISANITDASLRILRSEVRNNVASSERADGGGVSIFTSGNSDARLNQVTIADNEALCSGTVDCREGGLAMIGFGTSYFEVTGCIIEGNRVEIADGSGFGAGVNLSASETATVVFNDNLVQDNIVSAPRGGAIGLALFGEGETSVRRNQFLRNSAVTDSPQNFFQAIVTAPADAVVVLESTLIADGNGRGLVANLNDGGTTTALHLVNLTVANNGNTGLQVSNRVLNDTGLLTLTNVISADNGTDYRPSGDILEATNLIGGDPGFVSPGVGNYRLNRNSPAIDAGTFPAPVSISSGDADGFSRLIGPEIDIGAFEFGSDTLFADSFEFLGSE